MKFHFPLPHSRQLLLLYDTIFLQLCPLSNIIQSCLRKNRPTTEEGKDKGPVITQDSLVRKR